MTVTAYAKRRQQGNRDSISRGSAVLEGTIHVSTVLESDPMKYLGEICQCSWETHRNKNL